MLEVGSPSDIEVQTWLGEDPLLSSVDFLNFHLVVRLLCSLSYKGTDSINEGSALMTEAPPNVPYKTITFGGVKISTYGFGGTQILRPLHCMHHIAVRRALRLSQHSFSSSIYVQDACLSRYSHNLAHGCIFLRFIGLSQVHSLRFPS